MHSSLRILQIILIITQITTVKGSSNNTSSTSAVYTTTKSVSDASSTSVSPKTSIVDNSSVQTGSSTSMTSVLATSATEQLKHSSAIVTSNTRILDSSSMQRGSSTTSVLITSSTDQLAQASGDSNSFCVTISVPSATSSKASGTSVKSLTSLESSVTVNSSEMLNASSVSDTATKTESRTSIFPNTTSMELATDLSSFGLLTSPTQSMTLNYSLSSASRRGSIVSTTAEPKQTLTTSPPVSVNWTDWSVDSCQCQEYCSEKGGTVTASRQCYSHTKTLEKNVCTKHDIATQVVKCSVHCPVSGKEAFGSSISTLAVSILLVMLSSTFVRD